VSREVSDEVQLAIESVLQFVAVVMLSPLYTGIYERLKAMIEGRRGPSVFQPYFDIWKLMRKESTVPMDSSTLFLAVPYISFGIYCVICLVIPVVYPRPVIFTPTVDFLGGALLFSLAGTLKVLASMDSHSNFTALSSARVSSFSYLSEATLITVFFGVSLITGTNNPYVTMIYVGQSVAHYIQLDHVFILASFYMLWLFETGKLPVESAGLAELGMIDDGLLYEYSGKLLGILRWGSHIKQYLLGSVFLNVFALPWFIFTGPLGALADVGIMFGKWLTLIVFTVFLNTTLAKLRLFKVQDFLMVSFVLSIISLLMTVAGGGGRP
jgi:formate hydrogenlyase subunit 4